MTKTEIKPLDLVLDEELRYNSRNALQDYTISNRGVIYDPHGEELTPQIYRGKKVVGINGYLVYYDYAVCKLFHGGHRSGLTIGYYDGDCLNVDADNLYWRPRIQPKEQEPTEQEQPADAQTTEPGWIRRYDKNTCELAEEYDSWREAFEYIKGKYPDSTSYNVKYNLRQALRYGDTAYGCYWRASGPDMLGSRVHKHLQTVLSEPPTPKPQPEGWIRRYTPDGVLIAEYTCLAECLKAVSAITTQTPANITALIRRCARGLSNTYLGSKWEVSDISILGKPRKPRKQITMEAPTPQPEQGQEQKVMERKQAPTDTSAPQIEVEVEGIANPRVVVHLVNTLHYRIKISPSDR